MKLSDIMNRYPQTIAADDSLTLARDILLWGGFRHLPVVERQTGKLVGVLSERDVARRQVRTGDNVFRKPSESVAEAMTANPHTAGPQDAVTEAAARMSDERIGCLPITEKGKLVGLVTTTDILAAEVRAAMEPSSQPSAGPTVGDVMTTDPETAHPDDHLLDAAARMQQLRVRHLPVVDGESHVIGMLSDRDIRAAIGDPARAFQPDDNSSVQTFRVRDAMTSPAVTATADQSCAAMARDFATLRGGAVPVVDSGGTLVGMLSYVDLLRAFAEGGAGVQPANM